MLEVQDLPRPTLDFNQNHRPTTKDHQLHPAISVAFRKFRLRPIEVFKEAVKEVEGDKKVGGTVTDPNTPPIRNLHFKCALLAKCKCDRCDLTVKLKHNTHYFNAAVVMAQQSNAAFRRLGQTCNRNSGRD